MEKERGNGKGENGYSEEGREREEPGKPWFIHRKCAKY